MTSPRRSYVPLYSIRADRTVYVRPRRARTGYIVDAPVPASPSDRRALKRTEAVRLAQHHAAPAVARQAASLPRRKNARPWGFVGLLGMAGNTGEYEVAAYRNNTYVLGLVRWDTDPLDSTSGADVEQWVYRSRRASTRAYQHAGRARPVPAAAGYHRHREEPHHHA
ncbi:hypothetical protein ACFPC0_11205 [Streptomyces andamanensis]|uniref:Uncharacterized protein n=1 Tax=Streptomyces andamanensis TaxID=1565035 RepID=A0ABV8TCP4_9ACTN